MMKMKRIKCMKQRTTQEIQTKEETEGRRRKVDKKGNKGMRGRERQQDDE